MKRGSLPRPKGKDGGNDSEGAVNGPAPHQGGEDAYRIPCGRWLALFFL